MCVILMSEVKKNLPREPSRDSFPPGTPTRRGTRSSFKNDSFDLFICDCPDQSYLLSSGRDMKITHIIKETRCFAGLFIYVYYNTAYSSSIAA